jgi:hypothetical protein
MDPAKLVGSWSGNTVSYNYGTGGTYIYEIYQIGEEPFQRRIIHDYEKT